MLDSIKAELKNNELLLADFPEVVHPIHCLEGIHQRASGQRYQGTPKNIGWTAKEIVLPNIPGSKARSAVIRVAGITGRIRGMKHTVDEWKLRANGLDNHWLDCAVGASVAASVQGASLFATPASRPARKRLRLSELQKDHR